MNGNVIVADWKQYGTLGVFSRLVEIVTARYCIVWKTTKEKAMTQYVSPSQ